MIDTSSVDLYISKTGDIEIGANGDIKIERGADVVATEVMVRLKTYLGDYLLDPSLGCNLEDFIGSQATPATASDIQIAVYSALTSDGFLMSELREVKVFPISYTQMGIFIDIDYEGVEFNFLFGLDLREGILQEG